MKGKVYLVGAGPGDPELLTLKALKALEKADAAVYDRLVSDGVLALIPRGVPRFYAGKSCKEKAMTQDEIHALLIALAGEGKQVVRLKGGDPFLFGRGGEEAIELAKHHIDFEIIPGITSAQGCAAYAGIPLTHRGLASGVRFITGHRETADTSLRGSEATAAIQNAATDWIASSAMPPRNDANSSDSCPLSFDTLHADPDTTLVIYMGLANLDIIAEKLMANGLPSSTPAAAIAHGTTSKQQLILSTLGEIVNSVAKAKLDPPTLIIIGKAVALANQLRWFEPKNADDYQKVVTKLPY